MSKKYSFLISIFTALLFILIVPFNSFSEEYQPVRIKEVNFKTLKGVIRIVITSDKPISYYDTSEFEDPPTLIISIPEAELAFTDERYMTRQMNTANIKEVRFHQFFDYLSSPPKILRIIVEFKQKPKYSIYAENDTVLNVDIEVPKVVVASLAARLAQPSEEKETVEAGRISEELMSEALDEAKQKELIDILEEEKQDRILAKEAEKLKESERKKKPKEAVKIKEAPSQKKEPSGLVKAVEVMPQKKGRFESRRQKEEEIRKKQLEAKKEKQPLEGRDYAMTEELMSLQEGSQKEKFKEEPQKLAEKPPTVEELVRKGEEERRLVGAPQAPAKEEKKPKKKITNLRECIDIGLDNYMSAKIALDEVKLAELKVTEAKRALFPSASFKNVKTEGDIYDVDFLEREYTLRMEQPLYYGGRLRDAVRKAELNLEIAKRNYNKIKADFIAKVEMAFYSYVGAQMVLAAQEELKAEAEHILGIAKRRYDVGLSTEVEYLNLQNLYAQILYQINVAQMEMGSSKLQLEHELNLDTSSYEIEVKEPLQYAKIDIDLEKSVQFAYENRPELFINELTVRVKELEEKITRNKNQFKVDFTGSYGKGGGAYKTESLELGETWYGGVMLTKPLGGNTLSYNMSKDQTSPRLGQTTRTGSSSQSWEFNLLNNITRYSEEKNAQIDLKKALNELNEVKKSISSEVREAFFRYEKAIMQVDGSVIKIQLRQKEIVVNQIKVDVDEALLSELLENKIKLTDEKVSYLNAINSYFAAISSINKAIGLSGFYNVETPQPLEKTKVAGEKKLK